MEQIERITAMEQALNRVIAASAAMEEAQRRFEAAEADYQALAAYYGSAEWQRDLADDEAGRLPAGLRRGVLSQDGAWNALSDYEAWKKALL
mgnify:CR=1 FL=1